MGKLHRALKKSHESEKRLIKKCRELNAEIVANAAKVQTALKLSQEDQNTIASLKKELEEQRDQPMLERDQKSIEVDELTKETRYLKDRLSNLETSKEQIDEEIKGLRDQQQARKLEMEREHRRKERHEKDLKELKRMLDDHTMEIKSKTGQLAQAEDSIGRLEQRVKDQHLFISKQVKDFEKLNHDHQRTKGMLDDALNGSNQLKAEVELRQQSIKTKEFEIEKTRQEAESVKKGAERMQQKVAKVEQQVFNANREKEQLKQDLDRLAKQLESQKKLQDQDKKDIEELKRQRDILSKQLQKEKIDTRQQQDLVKMQESGKKTMEMEMQSYKGENQKQRKMIFQLEKEREKYGAEASEAMSKYMQAQEEVKLRDLTIVNLRKKIHEAETRLKQQQNLYEAVRSDRNLYSKNLIEAQDEIQEMRRKFKIT